MGPTDDSARPSSGHRTGQTGDAPAATVDSIAAGVDLRGPPVRAETGKRRLVSDINEE